MELRGITQMEDTDNAANSAPGPNGPTFRVTFTEVRAEGRKHFQTETSSTEHITHQIRCNLLHDRRIDGEREDYMAFFFTRFSDNF